MNPFTYLFLDSIRKRHPSNDPKLSHQFLCKNDHIGIHCEDQKLQLLEESDENIMLDIRASYYFIKRGSMERFLNLQRTHSTLMFISNMKSFLVRNNWSKFIDLKLYIQLVLSILRNEEVQGCQIGILILVISAKNLNKHCKVETELLYWMTRKFIIMRNTFLIKNFFVFTHRMFKKNILCRLRDLVFYANEHYQPRGCQIRTNILILLTDLLKMEEISLDEVLEMIKHWDLLSLNQINSDILVEFMTACTDRVINWDRHQKEELMGHISCIMPSIFEEIFIPNLSSLIRNITRLDHINCWVEKILDSIINKIATFDSVFYDDLIRLFNNSYRELRNHAIEDKVLLQLTHSHILNKMSSPIRKSSGETEHINIECRNAYHKLILHFLSVTNIFEARNHYGFYSTIYANIANQARKYV